MKFTIEKDVPILELQDPRIYPFHEMLVGDSFVVPNSFLYPELTENDLWVSFRPENQEQLRNEMKCEEILGRKFLMREVGDSTRIWRTA